MSSMRFRPTADQFRLLQNRVCLNWKSLLWRNQFWIFQIGKDQRRIFLLGKNLCRIRLCRKSLRRKSPHKRNIEAIRADRKITDEQIERENGASLHRYGLYRNVLLSDAEFQSLKEQFPGDYSARIDRLSEYMASCGKTYKNHLVTIRSWARKDAQRNIDYHHGMYTYDGNDSL